MEKEKFDYIATHLRSWISYHMHEAPSAFLEAEGSNLWTRLDARDKKIVLSTLTRSGKIDECLRDDRNPLRIIEGGDFAPRAQALLNYIRVVWNALGELIHNEFDQLYDDENFDITEEEFDEVREFVCCEPLVVDPDRLFRAFR